MPGMNGAEVARQVKTKRPFLPILFVTGFSDRTGMAGVDEAYILAKPFVYDELASKVRFCLAGGASEKIVRFRRN
jgi:DNA-binding response OmpR family regulator